MNKQYLFRGELAAKRDAYIKSIKSSLPTPETEEGCAHVDLSLGKVFTRETVAYLHGLSLPDNSTSQHQPHWRITLNMGHRDFLSAPKEIQEELSLYEGVFGDNFEVMAGLLVSLAEKISPEFIILDLEVENSLYVDVSDPEADEYSGIFGWLVPCGFITQSPENRRLVERALKNADPMDGSELLTSKMGAIHPSGDNAEKLKFDKNARKKLQAASVGEYNLSAWVPAILSLNSLVSIIKGLYAIAKVDVSVSCVQQAVAKVCGENWNTLKHRELTHNHPISVMYMREASDEYVYQRPIDGLVDVTLTGGRSWNYHASFNWGSHVPLPCVDVLYLREVLLGSHWTHNSLYTPRLHYASLLDNNQEAVELAKKWKESLNTFPKYSEEGVDHAAHFNGIMSDAGFLKKLINHIKKSASALGVIAETHELYLYSATGSDPGIKVYAPGAFPDLDHETPYEFGFEGSRRDPDFYNEMQSFMCQVLTKKLNARENWLMYRGFNVEIEFRIDYSQSHFSGPESDSFGERIGVICPDT